MTDIVVIVILSITLILSSIHLSWTFKEYLELRARKRLYKEYERS